MRILKELNLPEGTKLQDVKQEPISRHSSRHSLQVTQSYEQLINKRPRVLQALNKAGKTLDETGLQTAITNRI